MIAWSIKPSRWDGWLVSLFVSIVAGAASAAVLSELGGSSSDATSNASDELLAGWLYVLIAPMIAVGLVMGVGAWTIAIRRIDHILSLLVIAVTAAVFAMCYRPSNFAGFQIGRLGTWTVDGIALLCTGTASIAWGLKILMSLTGSGIWLPGAGSVVAIERFFAWVWRRRVAVAILALIILILASIVEKTLYGDTAIRTLVATVALLLVASIVGWLMWLRKDGQSWWGRVGRCVTWIAIAVAGCYLVCGIGDPLETRAIRFATFIGAAVGLATWRRLACGLSGEQTPAGAGRGFARLSVWTPLIAASGLMASVVMQQRYDLQTLFVSVAKASDGGLGSNVLDCIAISKQMSDATGGAVRLIYEGDHWLVRADFASVEDPAVLHRIGHLLNRRSGARLHWRLENLRGEIDLSPINPSTPTLLIDGGELSVAQVQAIGSIRPSMVLIEDVTLPSDANRPIPLNGLLILSGKRCRNIIGFLKHHTGPATRVRLLTMSLVGLSPSMDAPPYSVSSDEWRAMCAAAVRGVNFWLFEVRPPADGLAIAESVMGQRRTKTSGSIQVSLAQAATRVDYFRWLDSGCNVSPEPAELSDWDVLFGGPKNRLWFYIPEAHASTESFEQTARTNHWVYGDNADGEVTHLWLPDAIIADRVTSATSLESLRFDRRGWFGVHGDPNFDPSRLPGLPQLRRLYLPESIKNNDWGFLNKFPNLVHLQASVSSLKTVNAACLMNCPKLETLRLLGVPDPSTVAVLAKHPTIRLIVIARDDIGVHDGRVQTIRKQLPAINVREMPADAYQPEGSDGFTAHLHQVKSWLRRPEPDRAVPFHRWMKP